MRSVSISRLSGAVRAFTPQIDNGDSGLLTKGFNLPSWIGLGNNEVFDAQRGYIARNGNLYEGFLFGKTKRYGQLQ